MLYLTLTLAENLKLQLSPGLVASYDIQPGNGVGLFWDKHTHMFTYLLTCPRPTRGTLGGHGKNSAKGGKLYCVNKTESILLLF